MRPPRPLSWTSISQLEELDRGRLRFRLRDGNARGYNLVHQMGPVERRFRRRRRVAVSWDLSLKTADRGCFAGPIRKRRLAREVPNSLAAMAEAVMATKPR